MDAIGEDRAGIRLIVILNGPALAARNIDHVLFLRAAISREEFFKPGRVDHVAMKAAHLADALAIVGKAVQLDERSRRRLRKDRWLFVKDDLRLFRIERCVQPFAERYRERAHVLTG